ncbi:MAG: transporter ATP-binding protein [Geminicoccaceae bacterium]|nr:transporter ATP-binding protein [Geminicoccaceae bacterium]
MADVVLDGVTKRFGAVSAVQSMSLGVNDGELVVLLGPTGAGKTTTLRLVAGLETPDEGRIRIGGADVTGAAPAERDVAFVFQQFSLYPHYTVFENLAFPLRAPGRRWRPEQIRARVEEIANLLRIEGKLENRATRLSGGEMQRVAIGRALVRKPAVFLMDEPLSSLDAKLREELRIELKRIQLDLGATILYVTHDQVEALTLADRIGVVSAGEIVQVGTPRDVYERPSNTYVAQRLGSPPINLLPGGALGVTAGPSGAATVGIRPEDVVVGRGGDSARVLALEHLGAERVALLETEGRKVHALLAAEDAVVPGDSTTVMARAGAALFFDAAGVRIANSSARVRGPEREKAYVT